MLLNAREKILKVCLALLSHFLTAAQREIRNFFICPCFFLWGGVGNQLSLVKTKVKKEGWEEGGSVNWLNRATSEGHRRPFWRSAAGRVGGMDFRELCENVALLLGKKKGGEESGLFWGKSLPLWARGSRPPARLLLLPTSKC